MSGADLLAALATEEDVWEAHERQRETRALEQAFVAKWESTWRAWGVTQPGYEWVLAKHPTS